jgi:hypothetical protein
VLGKIPLPLAVAVKFSIETAHQLILGTAPIDAFAVPAWPERLP